MSRVRISSTAPHSHSEAMKYHRFSNWCHSQAVRRRSAKPLFPGPNPGGTSNGQESSSEIQSVFSFPQRNANRAADRLKNSRLYKDGSFSMRSAQFNTFTEMTYQPSLPCAVGVLRRRILFLRCRLELPPFGSSDGGGKPNHERFSSSHRRAITALSAR